MSLRERTRPGLGIIERCLRSKKEAAMPARRFQQIARALLLVVPLGTCVLIEHAQAQQPSVPTGPIPTPPTQSPTLNPSNPGTVPQPPYAPITPSTPSATPSTPSTVPSVEVTPPANEQPSIESTTARSAQTSGTKTRSVHHHRGRVAGITWPYYCGASPCVRIVVAEPPPVYGASVLWWPGFYDYADGNFARGRPRYGGYPRRSGYHGD
jgi:hypothetical protein